MSSLRWTFSDTLVLAMRQLRRIPRQPDLLIGYTIQPVMFVLLFRYVFGGAIATPGFTNYANFLMPGIIVQSIAFGGFVTALAIADDGRVAVMKRHGARIAVREVSWNALRSTPAGIVVETGERRFGSVALTGVNALDIRRLAPQLTRV